MLAIAHPLEVLTPFQFLGYMSHLLDIKERDGATALYDLDSNMCFFSSQRSYQGMGGGQSRGRGITRRGDDGGGEVADNKQAGYFILSFKEEKIKVLD